MLTNRPPPSPLSCFFSAPPSAGHPAAPSDSAAVPDGYTAITEGKATILQKAHEVFYNPVQVRREGEEGGERERGGMIQKR